MMGGTRCLWMSSQQSQTFSLFLCFRKTQRQQRSPRTARLGAWRHAGRRAHRDHRSAQNGSQAPAHANCHGRQHHTRRCSTALLRERCCHRSRGCTEAHVCSPKRRRRQRAQAARCTSSAPSSHCNRHPQEAVVAQVWNAVGAVFSPAQLRAYTPS